MKITVETVVKACAKASKDVMPAPPLYRHIINRRAKG